MRAKSGVEIQQPVRPDVVEAVSRFFTHHQFYVIADSDTGLRHHGEIVGAVAEGDDLIAREAQPVAQLAALACASTMRPSTLPVSMPFSIASVFDSV